MMLYQSERYRVHRCLSQWIGDLVAYIGRLFRRGKAVISGELARILERPGSDAENWQARLHKLTAGRLLGRFFAAGRARLREVPGRLGVHHLANLSGCVAR